MEGGLPKKDDFSTKVMNSSLLLHACVFMTIVEVEQLILPRARGRLVRLPYFVYQVQVLLYPYMFLLLIISQVLCT